MPDFLQKTNGKPDWFKIIAILIVGVIMVSQAFFLYLSSTRENGRNLMTIEKSPMRVIVRWDNMDGEVRDIDLEKEFIKERMNIVKAVSDAEFIDYKFNDKLDINIRTETIKADTDNLDIAETETLTEVSK